MVFLLVRPVFRRNVEGEVNGEVSGPVTLDINRRFSVVPCRLGLTTEVSSAMPR